jgi:hypothetical protein
MKSLMNIPSLVLSAYLIRLLYTGASVGDALVVIGLSALYAGWVYMESKKQVPVNKEIINRIAELEESHKVMKDSVNGLKLVQGLKRNG